MKFVLTAKMKRIKITSSSKSKCQKRR